MRRIISAIIFLLIIGFSVSAAKASTNDCDIDSVYGNAMFYLADGCGGDDGGSDSNPLSSNPGASTCTTIALPEISDSTLVVNAINEYIKKGWPTSPYNGLGASFVAGAQRSGINPFLAVAQLQHEASFATVESWWNTTPPSYNGFNRTATSSQPYVMRGTRMVYRWSSWKASLDDPTGDDWFNYVKKLLDSRGVTDYGNLIGYIEIYAPASDGNDPNAYTRTIVSIMAKLADLSGSGVSCQSL